MRNSILLCAAAVLIFSCASMQKQNSYEGSRYIITAEEIENSSAVTAYDAIQQLRPGLLDRDQRRSIDLYSTAEVYVYVNGVRYGRKEDLKSISAMEIAEIKYLAPSEATIKFGSDHTGGAFAIKLK